ncbi:MAG: hypothetical protein U9P61_01525, partial [Patescibacteria group bacterium]|nr:hypothetical protein [Patescibacteria group bacterium]
MDLLNKLIQKQQISEEDARLVREDVKETGRSEEQVLLNMGLISEDQEKFSLDNIPSDALDLIHKDSAKHYKIIPVSRDGNIVKVGMVNPDDLKAQEVLRFIAKQKNVSFEKVFITEDEFEKISESIFGKPEEREEENQQQPEKEFILTTKLKDDGYINKETAKSLIQEAEETKASEEEVLIRKKIISEADLFKIKSKLIRV